jgi:hypothetical protein
MPYENERPSRETLQRQFEQYQRQHVSPHLEPNEKENPFQNLEELQEKLENPEISPHDLDQLYQLAIAQLARLLQIDIAPTDPKFAMHNRNLNASINILLTFLNRQKKPPIDHLPELLKLIDENEAELRTRFGQGGLRDRAERLSIP